MTRVFVYEYTCATFPAFAAPALAVEGEAMHSAILNDFQLLPGVDAFTIGRLADEECAFRNAVRASDWALVIAPEFHDILLTRAHWVLEECGRLLGPTPNAIALCGDKLALGQWWEQRGVLTPPAVEVETPIKSAGSWVTKPRFGAGSLDMGCECSELGPMIRQPRVTGWPVSQAFLIGSNRIVALAPAAQKLSSDGSFKYLGGRVPLGLPWAERAEELARRAINGIPGLFGYVGVDMVLGDDGRDWAIEINPRLTTSYVGLRALSEVNLAGVMLDLAEGRDPPSLSWRDQVVDFTPSGGITISVPS